MFKLINSRSQTLLQQVKKTFAVSIPKVDYTPPKYTGPSKEEVAKIRSEYTSSALFKYYKGNLNSAQHNIQDPIMITDGYMQYAYDENGKQYLDMIGGILCISVGHRNPYVQKRVLEQYDRLVHASTIYYHHTYGALCKKIADKLPSKIECVFLVNSGSEANDLAALMARLHTGNHTILALNASYHGWAGNALSLTSLQSWKYNIPHDNGVKHVKSVMDYRREDFLTAEQNELLALKSVQDAIIMDSAGKLAAFWHEPIQGAGGFMSTGTSSYMQKVYKAVRGAGGVCVADEVQTGFGRTGTNYWGFENQGVEPDIVTMAKGIGNGAPLAAVATTREIAETLSKKIHFNTFGGNPISATAGLATMEYMDQHNTQANAKKMGDMFMTGLNKLKEKYNVIGDVRGQGLMIGIELVKDRKTKEPNTEATNELLEQTKNNQILMGKGGIYGNVIRIGAPLIINENDVNFALDVFDRVLKNI